MSSAPAAWPPSISPKTSSTIASVAVKVLKPELAAVLGADRFIQEIKTTAQLQHPHILPLHDSGTADGFLFYVMPYIEGETVRDKLDRETQLGIDEAVRITRDVADALDYAHRHGIIHRDIKPENILLHDGRPMVADFGIALAVSAAAGGRMTETGTSVGTPHYMSPEQATADKEITGRADIYSLASVLYEMLSGEPPHMGNSAQAVIMKIIADTPRPVSELRKSVPPNLAAAVMKALEKLPADRFGSAKSFADALADPGFTTWHTAAATAAGSRAAYRFVPWGLAGALAVALVVMAVARPRTATSPASPPTSFVLESAGEGIVPEDVAISPDGRDIVFRGRTGAQTRMLYHRALDAPGVRPIAGTEGASMFAIRPDRSVIFWGNGLIRTVRLDGGSPITYARVRSGPAGLSWSDRAGLVLGMLPQTLGLSRVEEGDTAVTEITQVESGGTGIGMHHDPMILEDGEHVIFNAISGHRGEALEQNALAVASLADGTWETVELASPPRSIVGIADGILVYIGRDGAMSAVGWDDRRRRPIGEPVRVPGVPDSVRLASIARNGTLAMVVGGAPTFEVVLLDGRGNATSLLPGETVTEFFPRYASDGRVAFGGDARGTRDAWTWLSPNAPVSLMGFGFHSDAIAWTDDGTVYAMPVGAGAMRDQGAVVARSADGSDTARAILRPGAGLQGSRRGRGSSSRLPTSFDLSRDGRFLALTVTREDGARNEFDLELVRTADQETIARFSPRSGTILAPRFSPDGRWVAYASNEAGRFDVFVRAADGSGGIMPVSDQGGGMPVWSRDGNTLFYRTGRSIVAADLAAGQGGGSLTVTRRETLVSGDFFGGEDTNAATYDVSPDGQILVARAVGTGSMQVVVRTGWIAGLQAQLADPGR